MSFNIGAADTQLGVAANLPATGANVTTPVLDLQATAPNSAAWREGLFQVSIPALPENTGGTGITIEMQVATPSGNSPAAPQLPVPGAFIVPGTTGNFAGRTQTITIPGVAATGSPAQYAYFSPEFDQNGSIYQFYQFLITVPANIGGGQTAGETITVQWIAISGR